MDISVIVPIYNVERYIEQSLRSLFTQTKTDGVEFILVNDATPDGSMKIARKVIADYPHLAITILNKPNNEGLAAARMTGLSHATGDYIMNIDSDDWCESTMLEELYEVAIRENVDMVVCDYLITYPHKEIYMTSLTNTNSRDYTSMILTGELHESLCNKLIKRSVYSVDRITFVPGIDVWEDFLLSTKLTLFVSDSYYLPKAYLHYRQNMASLSHDISPAKLNNMLEAITDITQFFIKEGVLEQYKVPLMYRKISAKNLLIKGSKGESQRNYAKLYPEATPYIMSHPQRPYPIKLAILLASKEWLRAANLLYWLIKTVKKSVLKR